jgi:hypothetical protein
MAKQSKNVSNTMFADAPLKGSALKAYHKSWANYDKNYTLWQNLLQYEPLKSSCVAPADIDNEFPEVDPTRADFWRLKDYQQRLFLLLHTTTSTLAMQNRLSQSIDVSMLKKPSLHKHFQDDKNLNTQKISSMIRDLHDSHGMTATLQLQIMRHFLQHIENVDKKTGNSAEFQEWKMKALKDCWRVMHQRNFDRDTMHIFTSMSDVLTNSMELEAMKSETNQID